jgi:hypothetical protein
MRVYTATVATYKHGNSIPRHVQVTLPFVSILQGEVTPDKPEPKRDLPQRNPYTKGARAARDKALHEQMPSVRALLAKGFTVPRITDALGISQDDVDAIKRRWNLKRANVKAR